jgi:hypothetical protein
MQDHEKEEFDDYFPVPLMMILQWKSLKEMRQMMIPLTILACVAQCVGRL